MRFRRTLAEPEEPIELNLIPLIDVIMFLLIFFIATTSFVEEPGVSVDKPQAASAQQLEKNSILFAITPDGKIAYGGKEIGLGGVRPTVKRLCSKESLPVVIQADEGARSGTVVRVIDEAKLGGAKDVSLATDKNSGGHAQSVSPEKPRRRPGAGGWVKRHRHGADFCVLPFSHYINRHQRTLELRKTMATEPLQQDEQQAPPPPEPPKPPEKPPEPQLADLQQQIPLSADLEVAMGSGGALAGFGDIRALTAADAGQADAFDVSDLEKKPEPVSQAAPVYPAELRKAKIEGAVTLVCILDETGRVEEPRVENSSRPEFEKPAVEAVRKWRFRPGMKDGQAVRTYIRIPMRFRVGQN